MDNNYYSLCSDTITLRMHIASRFISAVPESIAGLFIPKTPIRGYYQRMSAGGAVNIGAVTEWVTTVWAVKVGA